jgi:hypothetical protein
LPAPGKKRPIENIEFFPIPSVYVTEGIGASKIGFGRFQRIPHVFQNLSGRAAVDIRDSRLAASR